MVIGWRDVGFDRIDSCAETVESFFHRVGVAPLNLLFIVSPQSWHRINSRSVLSTAMSILNFRLGLTALLRHWPQSPIAGGTPAELPSAGPPKPLALRDMFFPLRLYSPPESESQISKPELPSPPSAHDVEPLDPSPPSPNTPTEYDTAIARVERLDAFLTPGMKSTLTCMLSVIEMHRSPKVDGVSASTHSLISRVASSEQTPDHTIKDIVDTIEQGLMVFCALGGASSKSVTDSAPADDQGRRSANDGASGSRKRQKLDADANITKSTRRSEKVRRDCKIGDPVCQICNVLNDGEVAHIIPYSIKDKKAIDFWKFVELFRGVEATAALRAVALARNTDTVRNVWFLCTACHNGFDHGKLSVYPWSRWDHVSLWPRADKLGIFPLPCQSHWSAKKIYCAQYPATIEFPRGNQAIHIACWKREPRGRTVYDKTLDEGHRITLLTDNALDLPLPHPLLFQIHAIICRVVALKAAAGYPLFPGFDRGDYDDSAVPAFIDNTFVDWLDQHANQADPEILPDHDDSSSPEPRIMHWLKLTPVLPVKRRFGSRNTSECDIDPDAQRLLKRDRGNDSDTDEERRRKYTVVLSEVGQRMAEKWQLVDRHLNEPESLCWLDESDDSLV